MVSSTVAPRRGDSRNGQTRALDLGVVHAALHRVAVAIDDYESACSPLQVVSTRTALCESTDRASLALQLVSIDLQRDSGRGRC